jgi:mono/diheme cytochrome c family protein
MTAMLTTFLLALPAVPPPQAREAPGDVKRFLERHCSDCHEGEGAKGGLDFERLRFDPAEPKSFARWVAVFDRVRDGEMPPARKPRPKPEEAAAFHRALAAPLSEADRARAAAEGRAVWRRLNRYEYENSLRDLLDVPWLEIRQMLPEDGEAHRFNKSGEALDVSHVQMAQYLLAAETALREAMASSVARPVPATIRTHTRDNPSFARKMIYNEFNRSPERATFPVLGSAGQPEVRAQKAPLTAGEADPEIRELEAMGVVAGAYEPLEPKFDRFKAPRSGRYMVRLSALSVWVGPGEPKRWWRPDIDTVSRGRRPEPVALYGERPPRLLRKLGSFDAAPEATVAEFDVHLLEGETIRPDPQRLFRSRPPNWRNPLAEPDGQPGVAYRWLEVEGPLVDRWPPAGHALMFGDLPFHDRPGGGVEVLSADPEGDARRLLGNFLRRAYRRPPAPRDEERFLEVVRKALAQRQPFQEAMIAGYAAVLCSPSFVCLEERPGELDADALASRLSYFLWNSPPDAALREALKRPDAIGGQVERLMADPRRRRFTDAFLDYWLDLRRLNATSPDATLYPDYYLDDLLLESADEEPRATFLELLAGDLPARHVVDAPFAMLNERLAAHYGLPPVEGVSLRKVALPEGSLRGGFLTQAAVLKVTANGTTTSPVLRGVWILERLLAKPVPPPPPGVPAVEPDIRGASTIREQLDRHRSVPSCAGCHVKIDPPGFALESFDVFGGFRRRYRALGDGEKAAGFGKNGQPFEFHPAQPVDASGELPGGGAFKDVREFKALLLRDERQIARALATQLLVYATGAPVRFGDREALEEILDRARPSDYGVRTIVREIALSGLFKRK